MGGIPSRLARASALERGLALACLAGLSAVASDLSYDPAGLLLWDVPLLPGVYFAAAIAIGFLIRRVVVAAVLLVALTLAWIAAVKSAVLVHEFVTQGSHASEPDFLLALSGAAGGLVGSALTAISVAALAPEFRAVGNWGRIVIAGTATGALLECAGAGPLAIHLDSLLPLFLAWQTSVAASIGYGMVPPSGGLVIAAPIEAEDLATFRSRSTRPTVGASRPGES